MLAPRHQPNICKFTQRCNTNTLDFDLLRYETKIVDSPIWPLVHQIYKQAGQKGKFVQLGALPHTV